MHPAQKQSIIAMVVAIKAQLDAICHIIGVEDVIAATKAPTNVPKSARQEYLDDSEEKTLEVEQEETRKSMLTEADSHAAEWEKQRRAIREETFL